LMNMLRQRSLCGLLRVRSLMLGVAGTVQCGKGEAIQEGDFKFRNTQETTPE
jgi:hypothetical protein